MNPTSPALRAPLTRIAEYRILEDIHTLGALSGSLLGNVLETMWNERGHMLARIAELETKVSEQAEQMAELAQRLEAVEADDFMAGEMPLPPLCFACRGETEGGVLCPGCTAYVVGGPVLVA